jgi:competence protein ComEC
MESRRVKSYLQLVIGLAAVLGIIIAVALYGRPSANGSGLTVDFLSVGQGDAEYIQLPSGEDILIDGGPDNSVLNELGNVMGFSDHEINLVILSHPHADHITGLVEVLKRYKVDEVWETGIAYPSATYDEFEKEIALKKIPEKFVKKDDVENFGEVKLSVLYPLSSLKNQKIDNLNNSSMIVRLDYRNFSVLFPGDAEKDEQEKILSNEKILSVTVLKMPHHGSQNGANEDFLKVVRPALAVIEVGKNNQFGHPHAAALSLLKSLAIKYYRTDQDGRVEISSNGKGYAVQTFSNE